MKKIKKLKSKLLLVAVIVLVIAGSAGAFYYNKKDDSKKTTETSGQQETINYDPPTEEEKSASNAEKDRIIKENEERAAQTQTQTNSNGKRPLKPVITGAGQYDNQVEVTSYVQNAVEAGQCTVTLTSGTQKITKTGTATKENSTAYCPLVAVNVAEFPQKGTWSAVVSYSSASSEGSSDAKTFEVK